MLTIALLDALGVQTSEPVQVSLVTQFGPQGPKGDQGPAGPGVPAWAGVAAGYVLAIAAGGAPAWAAPGQIIAPLWLTDANTVEQYNGANAQTFNLYNNRDGAGDFQRLALKWVNGVATLATEQGGTGVATDLALTAPNVRVGGTLWAGTFGQSFAPATDNALNSGAAGARWKGAYFVNAFAGDVSVGATAAATGLDLTWSAGAGGIIQTYNSTPLAINPSGNNVSFGSGARWVYDASTSAWRPGSNIAYDIGATGYQVRTVYAQTHQGQQVALSATDSVFAYISAASDLSNTVELANSTNKNTLRVYGTKTDNANFERLRIGADATYGFYIGSEYAGTGTARDLVLASATGKVLLPGDTYFGQGAPNPHLYIKSLSSGGIVSQISFSEANGNDNADLQSYGSTYPGTFAGAPLASATWLQSNHGVLGFYAAARDIVFATANATPYLAVRAAGNVELNAPTNFYGGFTDASNNYGLRIDWLGGGLQFKTFYNGTGNGSSQPTARYDAAFHLFAIGGVNKFYFTSTGLQLYGISGNDNAYDIGGANGYRWRSGYFGTSLYAPQLLPTAASGTDVAGANFTLAGGQGTGAGAGGSIYFSTATAGATGTGLNALTLRWYIDGNGGNLRAYTDNKYDFGGNGFGRPANAYVAQGVYAGNSVTVGGSQGLSLVWDGANGGTIQTYSSLPLKINNAGNLVVIGGMPGSGGLRFGSNGPLLYTPDASSTLEQSNGTTPQIFYPYNTKTDSSNYERGYFGWAGNALRIGTQAAGTGTARALIVMTGGVDRWQFDASGNFVPVAAYNIGSSSAPVATVTAKAFNFYNASGGAWASFSQVGVQSYFALGFTPGAGMTMECRATSSTGAILFGVTAGGRMIVGNGVTSAFDDQSTALQVQGGIRTDKAVKTGSFTVANLPAAATVGAGARAFVSDSNLPAAGNFGAVVAGGGANTVPVWSDGTNWYIG